RGSVVRRRRRPFGARCASCVASALLLFAVCVLLFFVVLRPPPRSTLFPYTTLFRSSPPWPRRSSTTRTRSSLPWPSSLRPCTSRSEEHTSELQSRENLVCRLLLEKKNAKLLRRATIAAPEAAVLAIARVVVLADLGR